PGVVAHADVAAGRIALHDLLGAAGHAAVEAGALRDAVALEALAAGFVLVGDDGAVERHARLPAARPSAPAGRLLVLLHLRAEDPPLRDRPALHRRRLAQRHEDEHE